MVINTFHSKIISIDNFRLGVVVIPVNRSLEIDTPFDLQAARLLAPLLDTPANLTKKTTRAKNLSQF